MKRSTVDGTELTIPVGLVTRALMRDPWVVSALLLSGIITAIYIVPVLNAGQFDFFTSYITMTAWICLAALTAAAGTRRISRREERQFWVRIAIACSFWAMGELISAVGLIDSGSPSGSLVLDALYFLYYTFWLFALETHPHLVHERRIKERLKNFAIAGRFLFAAGLFGYFVILPQMVQVDVYQSWIPSYLFYIALDIYLAARLIFAAISSKSRSWNVVFVGLALATFLVGIVDGIEVLQLAGKVDISGYVVLDVLWYAPFFLIVLSARFCRLSPNYCGPEEIDRELVSPKGVPLLTYSFAFPVLHFALQAYRSSPVELHDARETFVLVWLLLLGALNLVQYFYLEAWGNELQEKRRKAEERVLYLSKRDALTGLLNRREIEDILEQGIQSGTRNGERLAVLFVDLDGFKEVNDNFGHSKGDTVLQTVAERMQNCVRELDSTGRYGGDEFVLVLENIEDRHFASSVAERVLSMLAHDLSVDGQEIELSASIGISFCPGDGETPQELVDLADAAMYQAKARGGARFCFAAEIPIGVESVR